VKHCSKVADPGIAPQRDDKNEKNGKKSIHTSGLLLKLKNVPWLAIEGFADRFKSREPDRTRLSIF